MTSSTFKCWSLKSWISWNNYGLSRRVMIINLLRHNNWSLAHNLGICISCLISSIWPSCFDYLFKFFSHVGIVILTRGYWPHLLRRSWGSLLTLDLWLSTWYKFIIFCSIKILLLNEAIGCSSQISSSFSIFWSHRTWIITHTSCDLFSFSWLING